MKKIIATSLILLIVSTRAVSQDNISITVKPGTVFIEKGENRQFLNFDFLVANNSKDTLTLTKVLVSVFDKNDRLVLSKFLDNNGTAPSITLIPNREFTGSSSKLIFNPFADFNLTTPLSRLKYEWVFTKTNEDKVLINSVVNPEVFDQKANYTFPLKGKVLVYDGHDLYAHHRRFDYEFEFIKGLGISANFMRYAYDFILLDKNNDQFTGEGKNDADYFGFGKPVYSIGDGKVIYASNVHKDDKQFNVPGIATNPLELYGNCIAILHPNNTVSIYGHLKQNSLKIKKGDIIKAGQEIAAIGVSGSSFLPHLHFEVRTSIAASAEGVPSYFSNVYLLESNKKTKLRSGLVETGNIIEAK
jgi:murein DD-endopeptidase MepM/ murein hydrolase activator NlpD